MPSTITHEYYYRDVYKNTNKYFKDTYPENLYLAYSATAQGHDALFFYHFWNIPNLKHRQKIANKLANNNFKELCCEYINLIYSNNLEKSQEVKLILYGYIMHHILDSYTHPYIIYETEREGLHEEVETFIDKWMIEKREYTNPDTYPIYKLIPKLPNISDKTLSVINDAFAKIYGFKDFSKIYITGLKEVSLFLKLFRYDKLGIKKLGYNIIDSTKLFKTSFSWLSYKTDYPNFRKYINEERNEWHNPTDEDIISKQSFMDLYNLAIKESAKIISALEFAITNKEPIEKIMKLVPNRSAIHGLKCGNSYKYTALK